MTLITFHPYRPKNCSALLSGIKLSRQENMEDVNILQQAFPLLTPERHHRDELQPSHKANYTNFINKITQAIGVIFFIINGEVVKQKKTLK